MLSFIIESLSLKSFDEEFNLNIARERTVIKGARGGGSQERKPKKKVNLIKNSYLSHHHCNAERR
jgi:hypothetical protein